MDIKMIALDLDGTFLDDEGNIPPYNIEILKEFYRKGVIIVLSSGRMTDCVAPFADKMGIDCALIVYNGAMVKLGEKEKRKVIYHQPLPAKYGDILIDYCLENRFHLNYYLNDRLYAQKDNLLEKYALLYSRQTGAKFHFLKDIRQLKGNSPTKLILITDSENEDEFRTRDFQYEFFKKKFGKELNIVRTNPEYLEFLNKEVNKGVALLKISQYYGIPEEKIISFGDGENDIEMLKVSGKGIAPSNAKEKVKEIADVILQWNNNQACVGKYLSRFL